MARLKPGPMQTLVSTRLFSDSPLDPASLSLLRDRGFVTLELFATPRRVDLGSPAEARRLGRELEAQGMRAPWIHLSESYLPVLGREIRLEELTATLVAFGVEVVILPRAAWSPQSGTPELSELRSYVQRAGARLLADARSLQDAPVVESPALGFCWDLAFHEEVDPGAEEAWLQALPRWRLQGVRVAHGRDGHRDPPGEAEARLLEDLWPRLAPGTLVYDVETRGGAAEIRHAVDEIRAFHLGERRPPGERGGGVFWASLAPG